MPSFEYLILGGGVAGTTAAETIRQKDKTGLIGLVSGEPYFLYSRVLLPKFIRGEVGIEKVMLRGAEDYKKNGIEIFLGEEVKNVDFASRSASLSSGKILSFKKLLVASGGHPKPLNPIVQHSMLDNVFRLQTLGDAQRIKNFLSTRPVGNALVIGGGFMALEFIEILKHYGWKITLLCKEERFWPDFLDENGFSILSGVWAENSVEFKGKTPQKGVLPLEFAGADFIGVGIGLERNLDFMRHLAVKPPSGGIEVNEYLETGTPSVWAAGDVAVYPDFFSGRKRTGGNWSGAFMQGRIAGFNMTRQNFASQNLDGQAGEKSVFKSLSSYSIGHLGLSIAFVGDIGLFENGTGIETLRPIFNKEKKEYVKIFAKDGRVIGAVMINGQKFLGTVNKAIINKWDASDVFKKNT